MNSKDVKYIQFIITSFGYMQISLMTTLLYFFFSNDPEKAIYGGLFIYYLLWIKALVVYGQWKTAVYLLPVMALVNFLNMYYFGILMGSLYTFSLILSITLIITVILYYTEEMALSEYDTDEEP